MKIENKDGIVICSDCKYSVTYHDYSEFSYWGSSYSLTKYCNRYPEKNIIDTSTGEITYTQKCANVNNGHCIDYQEKVKVPEKKQGLLQKVFNNNNK